MAVHDLGAVQLDTVAGKKALEAEVGHYGGNQSAACEASAPRQPRRDQRHQLVAVENDAALVGDNQAIAIAVQCNPYIGPPRQTLPPHLFKTQSPTFAVSVQPILSDPE